MCEQERQIIAQQEAEIERLRQGIEDIQDVVGRTVVPTWLQARVWHIASDALGGD